MTKTESPTEIWSPCSSAASRTAAPLTKVPFRLSRSRMPYRSPSRVITQCFRESEGSLIENRFEGSRPTETSTLDRAKLESFNGPAMTSNLGFTCVLARSPELFSTPQVMLHRSLDIVPVSEQIALYPFG